jgi:hypothetical protein
MCSICSNLKTREHNLKHSSFSLLPEGDAEKGSIQTTNGLNPSSFAMECQPGKSTINDFLDDDASRQTSVRDFLSKEPHSSILVNYTTSYVHPNEIHHALQKQLMHVWPAANLQSCQEPDESIYHRGEFGNQSCPEAEEYGRSRGTGAHFKANKKGSSECMPLAAVDTSWTQADPSSQPFPERDPTARTVIPRSLQSTRYRFSETGVAMPLGAGKGERIRRAYRRLRGRMSEEERREHRLQQVRTKECMRLANAKTGIYRGTQGYSLLFGTGMSLAS